MAEKYIIQQHLIGATACIHYLASPLINSIELFGVDISYESNIDWRAL